MKSLPPILVLAGGFGTRLRSVVPEVPKPLAPVLGRPYLGYLLSQWVADGAREFVFLLHYRAEQIQEFIDYETRKGVLSECEITTIVEAQPMGTGGAVANAVKKRGLVSSFLVANADTWIDGAVVAVAAATPGAIAVIRTNDAGRYGSVQLEGERVVAFEEKSTRFKSGWINAGVYHLNSDCFDGWNGQPFSIERDLLARLASKRALWAVKLSSDFIDIGVPEDYQRFCRWIEYARTTKL